MWTPELVKGRFVEAADTERRMPLGGGAPSSGYWPAYVHSFEDMNGWGTQRLAEEREMRARRIPPSAAAISRYLEVLGWSAEMIPERKRQHLVWNWAFSSVTNRSFAQHCRRNGIIKMTAYRRLAAIFSEICAELCKRDIPLREPEQTFVLPNTPNAAITSGNMAVPDDEPDLHQTFHIFDGIRPSDTLTSPSAVESFEKFLAKTNKRRRREQERRRKLGLEDAA